MDTALACGEEVMGSKPSHAKKNQKWENCTKWTIGIHANIDTYHQPIKMQDWVNIPWRGIIIADISQYRLM